jgi:hypothetical protein
VPWHAALWAVWPCRDLGLPFATAVRAGPKTASLRVIAVGLFPRELRRWLQALFSSMPGTYRRVFCFTRIADLCD